MVSALVSIENAAQSYAAAAMALKYNGKRTDIGLGLEKGFYVLKENGRENAGRVVVILTDGAIDLKGGAEAEAESRRWILTSLATDMAEQKVRVFGIAFTEAADFPLLQEVGQLTRGDYFRAGTGEELASALAKAVEFGRKVCLEERAAKVKPEPVVEPVEEPVVEPVEEPVVDPIEEPAEEPKPEKKKKKSEPKDPSWPLWAKIVIGFLSLVFLTLVVLNLVTLLGGDEAEERPKRRRRRARTLPDPDPEPESDGMDAAGTMSLKMYCENHVRTPSVGTCFRCRIHVCEACAYRDGAKTFCPKCAG